MAAPIGNTNARRGRNAFKRQRHAAIATLKGAPGGWKKSQRRIEAAERAYCPPIGDKITIKLPERAS